KGARRRSATSPPSSRRTWAARSEAGGRAMATLAVRDLTAGYRELDIVHGVSLHVEPGSITGLIGPNGAGKSTLLRSIFGLVPPRRGAVTFMGEDVTGERPDRLVRKGMCFVPQNCNVFPRLTVEENLEMGAFVPPSEA